MTENQRNKRASELLEGKISKIVIKMAAPTIIAQLITNIYNLADTYFVSQLGTAATAAVGVNGSLERVITLLGTLIATGAGSYIARLLGEKKNDNADRVMSTSLTTGFIVGGFITAFGLLFIDRLVYWLGATPECAVYAKQYAKYVLMAAPIMIGSLILNNCLKSEGSAMLAMIGIGFGGILNCVLDPIFIFGLNYGVAGASMATALSKIVSFGILSYLYVTKRSVVRFSLKSVKFILEEIKTVLAVGSTAFFRTAFQVFTAILLNRIAGSFSTSALAAFSISNRIMTFPFSIILGFGMGCQPIFGFNWGAKRLDRIKETLSFGFVVATVGAVIMGALLFIFTKPLIHVFNPRADAEILKLGLLIIRSQCIGLPFHSLLSLYNMFYTGIGKALGAMLLTTARQGYCFIPFLLILPKIYGETGLAVCQFCADILSIAVLIPLAVKAARLIIDAQEKQLRELNENTERGMV